MTDDEKTILIVDDDDSMRLSTKLVLKTKGYVVDTAENGKTALQKTKKFPYNLLLLDVTLPDALGVELIPLIKQYQPNTAILVATAYATVETAIQAINHGASAYITKPFNIEGLLQTIEQTLEKQHLRNENQRLLQDLQQELDKRAKAEDALLKTQNELEIKVKQRTRQLTIANQELEQFVYSSYHDLRSPVRAIKLYAELALKNTSTTPDTGEYFLAIVDESERLFKLLDSILIHGRLGKFAENLTAQSVRKNLQGIVTKLQPQIDEIRAQIHWPVTDAYVVGNPALLEQIFTNLLDNALKYRHPEIDTHITIKIEEEAEMVRIDISDNGIGISPEYFDKIFQIFQRLHTAEEYSGAGIGLATVKKSVELMNGQVHVSSIINQGTTFHLKIPSATSPSQD